MRNDLFMTFDRAKTLRAGEAVVDKFSPTKTLRVVDTIINNEFREAWIRCDNGEEYHHRRLAK